ncbi:MAG TPA: SRPBCC domain-containing protein [Thermoanaerobaculia bacterium]|nr:SRPBCC domain-containing protein [Thermoanaerobaculia bacterium]
MPEKANAQSAVEALPELVLEREFDAPRQLVFKAWTDPAHLARWWGPSGFTNPRCELDVRPGGSIRIDMRDPHGTVYPMTGRFTEVAPPERLVFSAEALDENGKPVLEDLTTVTFRERGGKTLVTVAARVVRVVGIGAEYLKGMKEGWNQSLDRLEDMVPGLAPESESEILGLRLFDAPRDVVFRMFTDRRHVGNWWGPRGFTTTTTEMDVRPGGMWKHTMHGPDGTDYPNEVTYLEVVRPRRIVYHHGPAPHEFHVIVAFAEEGEKTRVAMRMQFPSVEDRRSVEKFGAVEGLQQTLSRLEEELEKISGDFAISRELDAPRDLVWKLWTESDHLMRWFGPKGMPMFHCQNDLRPGGKMHYGLRAANGAEMWGRWVYREIVPPERLAFLSSFSDPSGEIAPAPFAGAWPREMLTKVAFEENGGKTTVTVRVSAHEATDEEVKFLAQMQGSMRQGWSGTFEQLEQYVASL